MSNSFFIFFKGILLIGLLCLMASCGRQSHPSASPNFKAYQEKNTLSFALKKQQKTTPPSPRKFAQQEAGSALIASTQVDWLPTISGNKVVAKPETLVLPKWSYMTAVMRESISTKEVYTGQTIFLENQNAVFVRDKIIIEEGAKIRATVKTFKPARSLGRAGEIELELKSVEAVDGQIVPLDSSVIYRKGKSKKGMAWGFSIGCLVLGAIFLIGIFALLFLLIKGKQAKILVGETQEALSAKEVEIFLRD